VNSRRRKTQLFPRLTASSERSLADWLRTERIGGLLLLLGASIGLIWANSRWAASYQEIKAFTFGPEALHLNLSVEDWAKDGLLAIFFFVVGLELKRELVSGQLRKPATAIVPTVAAVGGMVIPAAIYIGINLNHPDGSLDGWAIPTATDIAFALAVLGVVGRSLPTALRAFLLTLAVVDDLLAIMIIAIFYTASLNFLALAAAVACTVVFAVLLRRRITTAWILLPLAFTTWAFLHASGVHATLAGVALGMVVPAVARPGERVPMVEKWEHTWRPISSGFAVPIFALFAAGVAINATVISAAVKDPVAQGVTLGLVIGKPVGIVLATFIVATFTRASLHKGLSWWDVLGVGVLAGIGFTVSLLIGDLSFAGQREDEVKLAVLGGSLIAALLGALILFARGRHYHRRAVPRD
jgi:NhaA family Na+:H+ antiporter